MKKMLMLSLVALSLGACSKDNDDAVQPATNTQTAKTASVDASSFTTWTYFSFSKGEVVSVTDFKEDLKWDIAFHRRDLRTNSGESGKGQGGFFRTEVTDFDAVTAVPQNATFTTDVELPITIAYSIGKETKANQPAVAYPVNNGRTDWTGFKVTMTGPAYDLDKNVFLFKTANGKVVKLQFLSYVNDKGKGGFVTFKYQFLN